ncbi:MAG: amino acid permease [Acidobacteriota bacterium]
MRQEHPPAKGARLQPALGLFDAAAISVGAIIGAGIYVVTGIAAGLAGPGIMISMVVAGLIAALTALSFAGLSAALPKEGGGYEYAFRLISPYVGFLSGWMWILSNMFGGAAVGFAHYLAAFIPRLPLAVIAAGLCLALTFLNYAGIRHSASVNNVLVIAKVAILLFFIGVGLSFVRFGNFRPFVPHGPLGILKGSAILFFAYGGYARVTTVAEEVKTASRTIPRAIILALIISTVLYLGTAFVAVGLIGSEGLAASHSPLSLAAAATKNSFAAYVVSLGAIIATASVLLMTVLGMSRMTYAMARNGQLPSFLSRIHPRFSTPHVAVLTTGIGSCVLVFGGFSRAVAVGTFALLFHHGLANLAALRLAPEKRRLPRVIPALGLLSCTSLLVFLSRAAWIIGLTGLTLGSLLYWVRGKAGKIRPGSARVSA